MRNITGLRKGREVFQATATHRKAKNAGEEGNQGSTLGKNAI